MNQITAVTSPQNKIFRLKYTGGGGYWSGTTGRIPCLNGFTAEVRLITPAYNCNNWYPSYIAFVADQNSFQHQVNFTLRAFDGLHISFVDRSGF